MCGICGFADFKSLPGDTGDRLAAMVASLRHRGPDQSGTWSDAAAALGHTRLSIIDLADGRQPLSNEDGTVWIAYNGEIYNFPELRRRLESKGHRFATATDTEAIVHLYEDEGIEAVQRLRGMFAFALYDTRRRALYLVRDRIGIKPLYYSIEGGRLTFGSEIKAILAAGRLHPQVRPDALWDYLTFLYVPAPKTMFKGIFKLEPGHWLRFDERGAEIGQYWDLPAPEPSAASAGELQRELIERLADSVSSHLMADVPLGAFLSGGVDSSAVVAMMARSGHGAPVTTSIGFDDPRYNELPWARRVAERYGTEHHERIVRADAVEAVETLAWHYDEPFADYSAVPTYYVSKAARERVTVALSGDGGDENFAGYRRYRFDLRERQLRRRLPGWVRCGLLGPMAAVYPKADWLPRFMRAKTTLANLAAGEAEAYCRSVGFLDERGKRPLVTGDARRALGGYSSVEVIRRHMDRAAGDDLDKLIYTDFKTWLPDDMLTKVDRASMAVALEVRVPLLDHEFVEFARRVPSAMKLSGGEGKAILKSALEPYLDHDVLYRAKQGFTPPLIEWLRGPLRPMMNDLLMTGDPFYTGYLERPAVARAWRDHQSGLRNNAPLLWAILMFELWGRRFVRDGVDVRDGV